MCVRCLIMLLASAFPIFCANALSSREHLLPVRLIQRVDVPTDGEEYPALFVPTDSVEIALRGGKFVAKRIAIVASIKQQGLGEKVLIKPKYLAVLREDGSRGKWDIEGEVVSVEGTALEGEFRFSAEFGPYNRRLATIRVSTGMEALAKLRLPKGVELRF